MKRLLYFAAVVFFSKVSAQSFPVKKANNEYIVTSLKESEKYKNNIKEFIRDKGGLYWFQNHTEIASFDGVNWKSYNFTNASGKKVPARINDIEVTDDGTIWLATAEGLYVFNPRKEKFAQVKQVFPNNGWPTITNCFYKGIGNFLLISFVDDGFYDFNSKNGELKYVHIDSTEKIFVLTDAVNTSVNTYVTTDKLGNYWGLTKENKGIWYYNPSTGEIKRSWKGEILPTSSQRLQGRQIASITYSSKDDALLLSYRDSGILEKLYLSTGKSIFYSFSDNLNVRADTSTRSRHAIMRVKIDSEGNEWLLVAGRYLVKLDPDISKCEYLEHDPDLLPLGIMKWLFASENMKDNNNNNNKDDNVLWFINDRGFSILKKRNSLVKQLPYEKRSVDDITPDDYKNRSLTDEDLSFRNMFFVNGFNNDYLLLQQNQGRPKLLRFDENLHITNAIINNEWKHYPAYFNPVLSSEDLYIGILRPQQEPLDFRKVIIKDFKVNLRTMSVKEADLNFAQRIWRYGAPDAANVYWLFSNGYLYSYDPPKNQLDSIFICEPLAKKAYPRSRIKGFDFPTVLDANSSTFWISFIADKELYKIDLKKRKVDTVFKSCLDRNDCLTSSVYQLYNFDSSRIYLKFNMSSALINPLNDSVTIYSDLFKTSLPFKDHVGSLVYKDWLCSVTTFQVDLQNTVTGKQKRLFYDKDFKWSLTELCYAPLVNSKGEMILMSSSGRGFVVFNLDSILHPAAPGTVYFSFVKLNDERLILDSLLKSGSLRLKYNSYDRIHFRFSDYSLIDQDKIKYEYTLYNGGDTAWSKVEGAPELTFTKITPGNYKLLIRATNNFGDYSPEVTAFSISIIPPFTQTIWFLVLIVIVVATILYGVYRYRVQQIKRLQTIRNNIASDLHDDIGSTLNSISIYSEVAKQQAGKEIPALDLIGVNSRKIIESMSDIVWTINPENDSFEKIIVRMRSFAHQLLKAKKFEYTFEVDDKLNSIALPMQVRKNFYLVFKEAITNVVKYSGANRVSILLLEESKTIILKIRDNGIGIPKNSETQGNGLLNMKRRADEINANLDILSGNGEGTGIEMMLKT